jgi:hypothetical protein
MKIYPNEYEEILDHFIKERSEGNEYIAFLRENDITRKSDLISFNNQYDVQDFCYENSTDLDHYDYLATRSVYRAMSEAMQDKNYIIESGGLIDIESVVNAYYRRLESKASNAELENGESLLQKNRGGSGKGISL